MALQIRRGTQAELDAITPLEGELIYTTDNDELYIGDGLTQGGILVSQNLNGLDTSLSTDSTLLSLFNSVTTGSIRLAALGDTNIHVTVGSTGTAVKGPLYVNTANITRIVFGDGSVQTTADTANPDQSVNTTSNVKFNSAVIATFLTATNIQATSTVQFDNLMYRGNYETFPINTSTANTSTFLVAQWDNSIRSTQKFMLQAIDVNSSPDKIHFQEISIVDDGTNQYKVEYGINTNAGVLGSYTVNASGTTGYLLFTPNALVTASPNAFKIMGEQLSIRNA